MVAGSCGPTQDPLATSARSWGRRGVGADDADWDAFLECSNRVSSLRRAVWSNLTLYVLRLDKLRRRLAAQDEVLRLLAIRRGQLNDQLVTVLRERTELEDSAWEAGAGR